MFLHKLNHLIKSQLNKAGHPKPTPPVLGAFRALPCKANQVIFRKLQPAVKTSSSRLPSFLVPLLFGRFLPQAGTHPTPSAHPCGSTTAPASCPHTAEAHFMRPNNLSFPASSNTSVVFQPVPAAVSPVFSALLLPSLRPRGLVLPLRMWELKTQEHILVLFQGCWLSWCWFFHG